MDIIIQVLDAYQIFRNKKIVHCDLTLKNIFYDFISNRATIIDTGISKKKPVLGGPKGETAGTPGYMAPELQFKKDEISSQKVNSIDHASIVDEKTANPGFFNWFFKKMTMLINPDQTRIKKDTSEKQAERNTTIQPEQDVFKPNNDFATFVSALKLFDFVLIVDSNKRTEKEYIILQREL